MIEIRDEDEYCSEMMKNYYEILGVDSDASIDEIKSAYRKLALKYHPDTAGCNEVEHFLLIQEAYNNLCDSGKRKNYDQQCDPSRIKRHANGNIFKSRPIYDLFNQVLPIKSESLKNDDFLHSRDNHLLEIRLSREEAKAGCQIPVEVPVKFECPYCGGTGVLFFFDCPWCHGLGWKNYPQPVTINIPPGIRSDTKFHIQMPSIDKQILEFNVFILID